MRAGKFLHNILGHATHKKRINSLWPVLDTIIKTKQLNLTQLGRGIENIQERSGIRRIDKLLANAYYQEHAIDIYQQIARFILGSKKHPIIIVDWSSLPNSYRKTKTGEQCVLRAALAAQGRSITLYEEVHPKTKENNQKVHDTFLKNLQSILLTDCRPIVVTDAGFKNPWFKTVAALGWDYIGRVVSTVNYRKETEFKRISTTFKQATGTPRSLGTVTLAKTNPMKTQLFLFKKKLVGRKKLRRDGAVCTREKSKQYAKSHRDPWVLVSSLSGFKAAEKVVDIYKRRMTIEEGFRDAKNERYGLSLNENHTIRPQRYTVWLLLSSLACLFAWLVGYVAEENNLHYQFQANTYRHKRILSFFFLGCQVIRKKLNIPIDFNQIADIAWGGET